MSPSLFRRKIGIPGNLSLSQSDRTDLSSANDQRNDTQSSGFRSSIVQNFALGGSSLEASASATASSIPVWAWAAAGVAAVVWIWYKFGGRK